MSLPYKDRLTFIQVLLASLKAEERQEGYDALFNLWLENTDSTEFIDELASIATKHENVVNEIEKKLDDLPIRDQITDTYLRQRLKSLDSVVSRRKEVASTSGQANIPSDERQTPTQGLQDTVYISDMQRVSTQNIKPIAPSRKIAGIGMLLFGISGLLLGLSIWFAWNIGLIIGIGLMSISLLILIATLIISG